MGALMDDISRIIASSVSRRDAFKLVGGAVGGAVLGSLGLRNTVFAQDPPRGPHCGPDETLCGRQCCHGDQQCCTDRCCRKDDTCCGRTCCPRDTSCCAGRCCHGRREKCCGDRCCGEGRFCCDGKCLRSRPSPSAPCTPV